MKLTAEESREVPDLRAEAAETHFFIFFIFIQISGLNSEIVSGAPNAPLPLKEGSSHARLIGRGGPGHRQAFVVVFKFIQQETHSSATAAPNSPSELGVSRMGWAPGHVRVNPVKRLQGAGQEERRLAHPLSARVVGFWVYR